MKKGKSAGDPKLKKFDNSGVKELKISALSKDKGSSEGSKKELKSELKSRRIKFSSDDRKYIPVIDFDGVKNTIWIKVKNTEHEKEAEEAFEATVEAAKKSGKRNEITEAVLFNEKEAEEAVKAAKKSGKRNEIAEAVLFKF